MVYVDVQDNDSDVDGDALTTSILSGPSNGSASVENSDSISYTPGTNFTGADTIIYQISDGSLTDSDTVFITVNNVNDAPVASTDNTSTDEETLVYVDVQDNDSDVDGDALTTSILSGPSNGSASVENSDSISYTPGTNFTGTDTIIYQISDGSLTDSDTVFITVNNVNDAPVAATDNTSTDEETLVYVDVQDNDSDVDGDALTTSILSGPSNGSASVENSDSISYTPGTNFTGTDTIIYQISDGSLTDSDTVFITVNNVNDAPVASTDNTSTDEETLVYVDVQDNDSDVDGDALTTSILSGPSNGSASVENSDSISYTPGTNFTGADTIIYQISDGSLTDSDTVFITVTNVNDAPVAATDNTSTDEETLVYVDVQDNDSDVDGDALTTSILSGPSNGSASVENSDSISYTPGTNFTGADTIIYQISDGSLTDSDTVFITVNNVNDAPVAATDNTSTDEETLVYVDVQDNDSDIDGDALTTSILSGPSNGSASVENSDSISYTPGTNFTGADTIIYQISDGSLTDSDTVFITVNNVNDAPVASTDNTITDEETLVYVDVQDNDSDVDGDALTTSILSGPSNGSASVENSDSISYTPGTNFTGADTIIYQISDGSLTDSDTVFITVNNVNDAPVASTDNASTDEETLVYVDVQDNDSDIDGDALTTSILSGPSNGSASVENSDSISYTPGTNFTGADTIIYQISDGSLTDSDTVFITVNNVNDSPVAATDNVSTDEETLVYVDVQDNDSDVDGDALTTSILSGPSNGSASVENSDSISYTPGTNFTGADTIIYQISDGSLTDSDTVFITVNNVNDAPVASTDNTSTDEETLVYVDVQDNDSDVDGDALTTSILSGPSNGSASVENSDSISYTPGTNFTGTDTIIYQISDGSLTDSDTVFITVNNVNDAPVAGDKSITINEDETLSSTVTDRIGDVDGDDLRISLISDVNLNEGTLAFNSDGTFTFEPVTNFVSVVTFSYAACDIITCDTGLVTIDILPVNDYPVALSDNLTTPENIPVSGSLSDNVTDVEGDSIDFKLVTGTAPNPVTEGTLTFDSKGNYTLNPAVGFNGTLTFEYEACDDGQPRRCAQATVTIVVTPVNDAPLAARDLATTDPDQTVSIDVLNNDSDPESDSLRIKSLLRLPENGMANISVDGEIEYTPQQGFTEGVDSIVYQVCDNGIPEACASGLVIVRVPTTELPPIAENDSVVTVSGSSVSGNVLSNDSDGNGDPLTVEVSATVLPENGILSINPDGSFDYTPNAGFNGEDTFKYVVCDDSNPKQCDTAQVVITVRAVNRPPIASIDSIDAPEDTPVNGTLLDNVIDPENGVLTFTLIPETEPTVLVGQLILNADGTYSFAPAKDFNGQVRFKYEVCDDGNPTSCTTGDVLITVTPVNDQPLASKDVSSTDPGIEVEIDVLRNDSDPDGDALTLTRLIVTAANGDVKLLNDRVLYVPSLSFRKGSETISYEVCDNGNPVMCDTAEITITVPRQELPPVAEMDLFTGNEDSVLIGNVLNNDIDGNNDSLVINTNPVSGPSNGNLLISIDGAIRYTPNAGFSGSDRFVYQVCDTKDNCDTALVTLTINAVNDAPEASVDSLQTEEEVAVSGNLSDNVTDEEFDNLTFSVLESTLPDKTSEGALTFNSNGSYAFDPAKDFNGVIEFGYEVCDNGQPVACDRSTVVITVIPVNDKPAAIDFLGFVNSDQVLNSKLSATDVEGNLLSFVLDGNEPDPVSEGVLTIDEDGTFTFDPVDGFSGEVTFDFVVCDNGQPSLCDTATASIHVIDNNRSPVARDTTFNVSSIDGIKENISDLVSDLDGDLLVISSTPIGYNGMGLTLTGDSMIFIHEPGFEGVIEFKYQVCDLGTPSKCDTGTIRLNVLPMDTDGDGLTDRFERASSNNPQDSDGDGIPDYLDVDDDNDGVLTKEEDYDGGGPADEDTDGDGVPDYLDIDDDGDGIPTVREQLEGTPKDSDTDGDGIPNYLDLDSDGDGIPDKVEAGSDGGNPVDTDGDGIPDFQELDSDGDGIPDKVEAGSDGGNPVDTDGDGIPDFQELDSDGDGIPDKVEAGVDGGNPVDTDGDGIPDFQELDSDGDGIPDKVEAGADGGNPVDTDGDGIPDFQELDSDGDGIPDKVEAGANGGNPVDTDGDGIPDFQELDSDGDGIPDKVEAGANGGNPVDTDGDGIPDFQELDSDGDGIPDKVEAGANGGTPVDTDGDGTPDFQELDSDGDGIPDKIEAGGDGSTPTDTNGDGIPDYQQLDSDGDGKSDAEEAGDINNLTDTDGDGIPDFQEVDDDGDGIPTNEEDSESDCDGDGIPDDLDPDSEYVCGDAEVPVRIKLSPNDDGINDWVKISPYVLDLFESHGMKVFNRWGNLVWELRAGEKYSKGSTFPDNPEGAFQGKNMNDKDLPAGTYFYILDLRSDEKNKLQQKGYIVIRR